MNPVVELKTSDPDGFMAGMVETTRAWREQG
jgi:hypothetical protein